MQPQEPRELELPRRPRVLILGAGERPGVVAQVDEIRRMIGQYGEVVGCDLEYQSDVAALAPDFVVVLGGDGSILRAAHLMGRHQVPVLGVNMGRLGFLADLLPEELPQVLPQVCCDGSRVIEHIMFDCQIRRGDTVIAQQLGLNEATIWAGAPFSMIDIDLYVDSIWATTYSCDGIILCGPVGSTAHSLAAGGPIVRKDLQAFVITPINPHTLTNRPVVDSADRVFELAVKRPMPGTSVVVDGHLLGELAAVDRVRITRSESRFQLIQVPGHNYYRTLREKLGWGGRLKLRESRGHVQESPGTESRGDLETRED